MSDKIKCECHLMALSSDIPSEKRQLSLPHGVPISIGRSVFTGITDPQLSRQQAILTADCSKRTVHIKIVGTNDSGLSGFKISKDGQHVGKNGDVLNLLIDSYSYVIKFIHHSPPSQTTLKTKCAFTNVTDSKKRKIDDYCDAASCSSSSTSSPNSAKVNSMIKLNNGSLYVLTLKDVVAKIKIAAFDLDWTIIKPKSGNKFPKDKDDWQLCFSEIPTKLKYYLNSGYKIVIFTNQKSTDKKPFKSVDFENKLVNIFSKIGVPVQVFISTGEDKYRKPVTGMWEALDNMNDGVAIEKSKCLYCGDAAGRKGDHSFSDMLFAENLNIPFYTPECLFQGMLEKPFSRPAFDPKTLIKNCNNVTLKKNEQEIIIMVGFQGSGKSTLTKKIINQSKAKYECVSQDVLKSLPKCIASAEKALKMGKSVIVDNTNLDADTRRNWTNTAKKHKVSCRCIWLDISMEHCRHNNFFRQLTDKHHTKISSMIYNISKKKFQAPSKEEGFTEICKIPFAPEFSDKEKEKLYFQHLLG